MAAGGEVEGGFDAGRVDRLRRELNTILADHDDLKVERCIDATADAIAGHLGRELDADDLIEVRCLLLLLTDCRANVARGQLPDRTWRSYERGEV